MQKKPQPLAPPEGSKASVYTESHPIPAVVRETSSVRVGSATARHVVTSMTQPQPLLQKKKTSPTAKIAAGTIIGAIVIALAVWGFLVQSGKKRQAALYQEMVGYAAKSDATELPVNSQKLEILLNSAIAPSTQGARSSVFKALILAKSADNTDVDQRIAVFATSGEMLPEVREGLIREVLLKRKQPTVVPYLLDFVSTATQESRSVVAALQVIRSLSGPEQTDPLLDTLLSTGNDDVRRTITDTLDEIIKNSPDRSALAVRLSALHEESPSESARFALLRLLGRCGGTKAEEIVKSLLNSQEPINQNAALVALGTWADVSAIKHLTDFISKTDQLHLRNRAFDSAVRLLASPAAAGNVASLPGLWKNLSAVAKTNDEQSKIIRGLAKIPEDWSVQIIRSYQNSDDGSTVDLASSVLEGINELRRIKGLSLIKNTAVSVEKPNDTIPQNVDKTPIVALVSATNDVDSDGSIKIEAEKFISTDGVVTEPSDDIGGGEQLSGIDPDNSTTYRIQVPADGTYNAGFRIRPILGGSIRMYANNSQTSCGYLELPNNSESSGWYTYKTQINLPAGECKLILKYEGKNGPMFNMNWFSLYQGESMQSPTSLVASETTSQAASENINTTAELPDGEIIQAENYYASKGVQLQKCDDVGGGKHVGFIQNTDTTTHKIQVPKAGVYSISFRVLPLNGGTIKMYANNSKTSCGSLTVPNQTAGEKSWVTIETKAELPAGSVSLRLDYSGGKRYLFDINYFTIK